MIYQILPKNLALRILLIALALFVFSVSVISVSASPIIFGQEHHSGISEIYTYDEVESSAHEEVDQTGGLRRVLSVKGVLLGHEVLADVTRVAARGSVPTGKFYSVAFETALSKNLYSGVNASRHFTAANKAMLSTLDDVTMKNLNIVMKTRPNGSIIMNRSPHNWVWHHDVGKGVMQLVFRSLNIIPTLSDASTAQNQSFHSF